jgi:hypothetical protein
MVTTNDINKRFILKQYETYKLVAYTVWLEFPFYKPLEFERSGYDSEIEKWFE